MGIKAVYFFASVLHHRKDEFSSRAFLAPCRFNLCQRRKVSDPSFSKKSMIFYSNDSERLFFLTDIYILTYYTKFKSTLSNKKNINVIFVNLHKFWLKNQLISLFFIKLEIFWYVIKGNKNCQSFFLLNVGKVFLLLSN